MTIRPLRILAAGALLLALTGCASTSSESETRAPYTGTDSVGAVSASMLVGSWHGRAINPPNGVKRPVWDVTYSQDGKAVLVMDDTQSGMNMKLQLLGSWQVQGEEVHTQIDSVTETSGNALGGLVARFMSSLTERMSGSANIYEATANRVILVGSNGDATELTRQ